jgi:CRP-like cAMP-binding protein
MSSYLSANSFLTASKSTLLFSTSRSIKTISKNTRTKQDKYKRSVVRRVVRLKDKKPNKSWLSKKLPKIYTPQNMAPKQTQPLPDIKPIMASKQSKKEKGKKLIDNLLKWIKENAGIIILNAGSVCTLTAFTRSDILELRCLSMAGSLSSVVYFLSLPPPKVWFPPIWSGIFAITNAYKVYFILEERKGKPKYLTMKEMKIFEEHFMPHGVTPRMFEKLLHISTEIRLEKGQVLIEKGIDLEALYVVKSGCIDAVTGLMKRRVTAASTDKGSVKQNEAGNSGAWIGELALLDILAAKDIKKPKIVASTRPTDHTNTRVKEEGSSDQAQPIAATASNSNLPLVSKPQARTATKKAILTYIASEDTIVYAFDHEELCELLNSSADMRAAFTRAMTAAVVGKVVNLYLSKVDAEKPIWQRWLEDNRQGGVTDVEDDNKHVAVPLGTVTELKKQS